MKLNQIAAALGAVALGLSLAGPASAQIGDSKADPRSRAQGPADNPSTSNNPVGSPNSTNVNRCAHLNASSKEHADCMANLRRDNTRSSTGASTTRSDRPAASARGTTNEGRGVTQNPNTSQNPNTGGSQVNRGGDSNIKSNPGVSSSGGASMNMDSPALPDTAGAGADSRVQGSTGMGANRSTGITDNPNTSANPNTGGTGAVRGGDSGRAPQGGN